MSKRFRPRWIPALGVALVLAVLSGASPVSWYSSTFRHDPRVEPPAVEGVERRPIVTSVWGSGAYVAMGEVHLEPDLLVRYERLDWNGSWWTPLLKSGTLDYALSARAFGGPERGGCDLRFEGALHAGFRGLCSPSDAREALEDELKGHILAQVRTLVGS